MAPRPARYTVAIAPRIRFEPWPHGRPSRLSLAEGEWHAWLLDHSIADDGCLAQDERERARRFVFERDRAAYIATRASLRRLLTAYTGDPPEAHVLVTGPRGKPRLASGALEFNVSHSGTLSLLAFARAPLGVDIERIRPVPDAGKIAARYFTRPETHGEDFFVLWTRYEASLKAVGEKLGAPPPGAGLTVYDFEIPGYAAALAASGASHAPRAWQLSASWRT